MVSTLENIYIGITEGTILYQTKDGINVLVRRQDSQEILYNFFSINDSGKKILEKINGKEKLWDFINRFCKEYKIDYEKNKSWILNFIVEMMKKNSIKISENPINDNKLLHEGDKDFISPMHATIEITEKCNLKCKHCYLEADIKKTAIIDYNKFESLVDELIKNNVVNVELTGGEIFMHPKVYNILKLSFEKFAMVGILTNGTIMTDEVLELLEKNKEKTIINISIDHVDPSYHDEFRGMNGAWKASCQTVRKLSEKGINVRVASSITKDNMWDIDKLADFSASLGAKVFSFNFVEEFGRGAKYQHNDKYVDVIEYNNYINNTIEKHKDLIPIIKQEDRAKTIEKENCGSGTRSIVIGADGEIRPCALSPKVNFMGNVFKENFKDIFKKENVRKISNILPPHIKNGCDKSCRYLLNCHGCFIKGFERNKINNSCCSWIKQNHLEEIFNLFKGQ